MKELQSKTKELYNYNDKFEKYIKEVIVPYVQNNPKNEVHPVTDDIEKVAKTELERQIKYLSLDINKSFEKSDPRNIKEFVKNVFEDRSSLDVLHTMYKQQYNLTDIDIESIAKNYIMIHLIDVTKSALRQDKLPKDVKDVIEKALETFDTPVLAELLLDEIKTVDSIIETIKKAKPYIENEIELSNDYDDYDEI